MDAQITARNSMGERDTNTLLCESPRSSGGNQPENHDCSISLRVFLYNQRWCCPCVFPPVIPSASFCDEDFDRMAKGETEEEEDADCSKLRTIMSRGVAAAQGRGWKRSYAGGAAPSDYIDVTAPPRRPPCDPAHHLFPHSLNPATLRHTKPRREIFVRLASCTPR